MKKEKQIQISQDLFLNLVKYHLVSPSAELQKAIEKGLETKIDSMVKHELYTQYKTSDNEVDRERARQEYLDKIGIHPDFRW